MTRIRLQHPVRGEHTGVRRHDDRCNLELVSNRNSMQRPRSTERDQRELPGVDSSNNSDFSDCVSHRRIGDCDHSCSKADGVQVELVPHGLQRMIRQSGVERHVTAKSRDGRDSTEAKVGVGNRRFDSASAVTGRTGLSASRAGTHTEAASFNVADAPAPSSDRVDRDGRREDRVALELGLRLDLRLTVNNKTDVEGRPAHVYADEAIRRDGVSKISGDSNAGDCSSDWPREEGLDGTIQSDARSHDTAVRLHHPERGTKAAFPQAGCEFGQVFLDDGGDVGANDRSARALVLPPLGSYI